jgi:Tol biopolymer transport system component
LQPLPPRDTTVAVSPDREWVASEGVEPCKDGQDSIWECYRQTGAIYLQRVDGSGRRLLAKGHLDSWTPDGRVLITSLDYNKPYAALDVDTGERRLPLDSKRVAEFAGTKGAALLGTPRWSADTRYIAARVSARWPGKATVAAIVIADATGRPLRLLRSRYLISMLAWSPRGHRLAYTTSGFPDPHELFVVDSPRSPARRVLKTERHFDWVSWAPDSQRLVLDDENENLWLHVPAQPPYEFIASKRLGGRPLWCCPVNAYATQ